MAGRVLNNGPARQTSSGQNPRGSGGCVLYPGSKVLAHSLRSATDLNGQEGICELWDPQSGRMHVRFNSEVKALRPTNLLKVKTTSRQAQPSGAQDDLELNRVLEIFQKYDANGDGIIERREFLKCLKSLGLSEACLTTFLASVDKDGDGEVQYDEFCEWAMSPGEKSMRHRVDVYWPDPSKASKYTPQIGDDDEAPDEARELTVEDVTQLCGGSLPDGWPSHGITVVNNMKARFPEYPVEGIVWAMRRNNFIGGKVIAAIRATGAREVEVVPPSAVKIGIDNFPATYKVRSREKPLAVYQQTSKNWSFQNMRDERMQPVGKIDAGGEFIILEVKRGSDYSFCFGRIEFPARSSPCWVVLGLEVGVSHWTSSDACRSAMDLNYTEAERVMR